MSEQRLIELETKFSHQESIVEELQKALYDQYKFIENLEKKLKLLTERFDGAAKPDIGPGDEKPPHY
jgi:SlyX protein